MTEPAVDPMHADLAYNGPTSHARVDQIIASLGPLAGARVLDVGCGWAEMLLRVLATEPTATGLGIDRDPRAIRHGLAVAAARGLADRVELRVGDAARWAEGPVDVALCVGSCQVFSRDLAVAQSVALGRLRELVRPGGRVVFGEGYWTRPPGEGTVAGFGGVAEQYRTLGGLVELAHEHGYRMLALSRASTQDWDEFQSGYLLGWERWLLENPGHPDADEVRARADRARTGWLRDWSDDLGFAYLTLVTPTP